MMTTVCACQNERRGCESGVWVPVSLAGACLVSIYDDGDGLMTTEQSRG